MNNTIGDIFGWAFLVGGILVMTRPNSQGPKFVGALGSAGTHLVQASTGQSIKG